MRLAGQAKLTKPDGAGKHRLSLEQSVGSRDVCSEAPTCSNDRRRLHPLLMSPTLLDAVLSLRSMHIFLLQRSTAQ